MLGSGAPQGCHGSSSQKTGQEKLAVPHCPLLNREFSLSMEAGWDLPRELQAEMPKEWGARALLVCPAQGLELCALSLHLYLFSTS